ncbi:MAG: hypothetical protein Q9162_000741 [Coniocarpon cinnabarinum]
MRSSISVYHSARWLNGPASDVGLGNTQDAMMVGLEIIYQRLCSRIEWMEANKQDCIWQDLLDDASGQQDVVQRTILWRHELFALFDELERAFVLLLELNGNSAWLQGVRTAYQLTGEHQFHFLLGFAIVEPNSRLVLQPWDVGPVMYAFDRARRFRHGSIPSLLLPRQPQISMTEVKNVMAFSLAAVFDPLMGGNKGKEQSNGRQYTHEAQERQHFGHNNVSGDAACNSYFSEEQAEQLQQSATDKNRQKCNFPGQISYTPQFLAEYGSMNLLTTQVLVFWLLHRLLSSIFRRVSLSCFGGLYVPIFEASLFA